MKAYGLVNTFLPAALLLAPIIAFMRWVNAEPRKVAANSRKGNAL